MTYAVRSDGLPPAKVIAREKSVLGTLRRKRVRGRAKGGECQGGE